MRSRLDLSEKVENKDRRFGAALEYYPARIITGGRTRTALFTARQISEALARYDANQEDVTGPSMWERVKAWFVAR